MSARLRLFIPLGITLCLGLLLWLGLGNNPYSQDDAPLGRNLPSWQSQDLFSDRLIHTDDLKGKPFVLNVWASWCPACRAEHPLLVELAGSVTLYGLNYRDKAEAARSWLREAGNPYQAVLADPDGKLALELGVYGTPETYLFGADGALIARHTGELTREIWQRQFVPLLSEARNRPSEAGNKSSEARSTLTEASIKTAGQAKTGVQGGKP